MTLLDENKGLSIRVLALDNVFSDRTPKAKGTKEKAD